MKIFIGSFSDDSFEIVEYSSCEDAGNKEFALTGKKLSKENSAQSPGNHISSPDQVDKTEEVTYSENSKELIQREQGNEKCGHVLCTCDNTQEQFPHIPVFEPASLKSLANTLPDTEVQDSDACGCNSRLIDGPQSGLILDVNYLTKQKPTCVHCSPDLSSARKFAFSNSSSSVSTSNVSLDNPTNCTSHFTDNASHSTESISHSTGSVSQSTEYVSDEPTSDSEHLFDSTCRTCTDTDSVRQQSDSCTEYVESTSQERLCRTSSTDYSKIDQQQSFLDEQGKEDIGKDLKSNNRESENLTSTRRDICLPLRLDIPKTKSPHEEQSNEKANEDSSREDQSVFVTDSLPTPVCRRGTPLLKEDLDELLDKDGRLVDEHALRKAVFMGGVDPDVRKQVWQFLFGLYPCSSTTREREELLLDYIMKYHEQMSRWKTILMLNAKPGASLLQQGLVARYQIEDSNNELRSPEDILEDPISEFEMLERNLMAGKTRSGKPDFNALSKNFHTIDISSPEMQQKMDFMKIQSQVYVNRQKLDIKSLWSHIRVIDKDVPRTDRDLDYFRGAMNPSLTVLRNILITFAAFNSDIGYAQGMNDILAQFLVVFDSEVEAYWCFSNYMKKIQREFTEDGMVNKIWLLNRKKKTLEAFLRDVDWTSEQYFREQQGTDAVISESQGGEQDRYAVTVESQGGEQDRDAVIVENQGGEQDREAVVVENHGGEQDRDAVVLERQCGEQDTNAVVLKNQGGEQDRDAVVLERQCGEQDTNAVVMESQGGKQDTNAVIVESQGGEQDTQAVVVESQGGEQHRIALVVESQGGEQDRDAVVVESQSGEQDIDAAVMDGQVGELDRDAVTVESQGGEQDRDAVVVESQSGEQDMDAVVMERKGGELSTLDYLSDDSVVANSLYSMSPVIEFPMLEPSASWYINGETPTEDDDFSNDYIDSEEEWKPPVGKRAKQIVSSSSDSSLDGSPVRKGKRKKTSAILRKNRSKDVGEVTDKIHSTQKDAMNCVEDQGNTSGSEATVEEQDTCMDVEHEIVRAQDNRNIYIKKVLKNDNIDNSSQPNKKLSRVYNQKHSCFVCKKMVLHLPTHLQNQHKTVSEVSEALSKTGSKRFDKLRAKGDDMHNKDVLQNGKGELIISRRPKEFKASDYGPCPSCLEWFNLQYLDKHHKKVHGSGKQDDEGVAECPSAETEAGNSQTKRNLQMKSDVMAGRVGKDQSYKLVREALEIMIRDDVKLVVQSDDLIKSLGESWMRRNFGNKKAKYYASQHMRLMAKLLMNLRAMETSDSTERPQSLWDFLVPVKFNLVVSAAVQLAYPFMDDIEDLRSPSNAIKVKYDILKALDEKWTIIKTTPTANSDEAEMCDTFTRLMNIQWAERVTKMARTVLATRSFNKEISIPAPVDIEALTTHLCKELKKLNLKSYSEETFRRAVQLSQTRLLLYNKRRSGEIDNISVRQFAARKKNLADVDASVIGEMSPLEKHLLESQDLMTVRGKRGRPVPVIIPGDVKIALNYIAKPQYREAFGAGRLDWLFPSKGQCSARSYDSLNHVCGECSLKCPSRITSVTMRKYTATLTQMLNLTDSQLQWACDHLGHTKKVHLQHYRQLSGYLERVQIGKLMIIQDMNLTGCVKGRGLTDKELNALVALLLQEMDPALYEHLKANDLGDLLFCHRWLLLGFKREFKFMDSLRCFEILSSHHLELTSLEADKARRHELKKEFEHLRGVQRSTAPSDTEAEYTFELFMCIALLQKARCELMECTDTAMVFSIINQLEINLDDILLKSAELFYFYCKKTVEDSFLLVDSPQPQGSNIKRLQ